MSSSSSSSSSMMLKEKVLHAYERILSSSTVSEESFWSEFFLLRPKVHLLETEISRMSESSLTEAVTNINTLVAKCIDNLGHTDHPIRVVYALQTLCGLVRALNRKLEPPSTRGPSDVVHVLLGFEHAEQRMQTLIAHINFFLLEDEPCRLKDLCLKLLLVLATGSEEVTQNALMDFLMANSVFDSLVFLLSDSSSRLHHGKEVLALLMVLLQYRKHECVNPYVLKLSVLDNEQALHGLAMIITDNLIMNNSTTNGSANVDVCVSEQTGFLSSLTSIAFNMFGSEDLSRGQQNNAANVTVLMALYEGVHLNRNFIALLGQYQPSSSSESSTESVSLSSLPSTVMVSFLEHCSMLMQDPKCDSNLVRLCLIILQCVSEDQLANSIVHDQSLTFRVGLQKAQSRHRKIVNQQANNSPRPLASWMMDLCVEFIRSHLMKRLPFDHYSLSLGIVHRLLSHQKRNRVRLTYNWRELWTALIALLKFIVNNESQLSKKHNVYALSLQAVTILNVFVTYGDTFLSSPTLYDELYYEMVRCNHTFDSLHATAMRHATSVGQYKESAVRVSNLLVNIRAITAHFSPKIESYLQTHQVSTPTEEQILELVKDNYDTLTLKLQDGLEQYERYSESPRHVSFFCELTRRIVIETERKLILNDLELQSVLQDFSAIQ